MYFKLARFFTILSLFAIPIVLRDTLFPFIVGKYAWFRGGVSLALACFLLGLIFSEESASYLGRVKKVVTSPIGIAVGVFCIVFLLAGLFGFDPHFSFWSNFERGEGGIQLINLYIFFVLLTTLFKDRAGWRKVLGWAVFVGVLASLYGFLASFGVADFIGSSFKEEGEAYRFQGSLGNPAYVGVYSLFLLFYVFYILATTPKNTFKKEFIKTGILILSGLAFIVVFYLAATRGALLGLLASLFLFLVFVIFSHKKLRKPLGTLLVIGVILAGIFIYFKDSPFIRNLPGSRIFDISLSTTTFGHRTIMWKVALEGFKERPILGWGPENYYQVFDRHFNTAYFNPPEQFGAWFDRAHSFIFDYLAETGIVGLASFLAIFITFYFVFFSKIARRQDLSPWIRGALFALPIAYLIQGLVLFDVLVTYMNFFLFLALVNYHFLLQKENPSLLNKTNTDTQ